ncbi:MAG TPA: ComEC/Rec2 family competence protein [Stellaceae bacterium]|nr:ComEC/Rec2 family competence protein [Stellaceae bacterium]
MADLAVAGGGIGVAPERAPFRPVAALVAALVAEQERRVLWLPVFFGAGIASYFALTFEPPAWTGFAGMLAGAALAAALRRRPGWREAAVALAFLAAGFAAIQHARVADGTAMLQRRLGPAALCGTVVDIDAAERGWRIIMRPDPLPGLVASEESRLLRVHIAPSSDALSPGDRVRMKAMLYPVPAPVLPGGRDLERELYFAGIGGVGYSFGAAHRIGTAGSGGWQQWLLRLRTEMTRRINAALPGSTGGVASAVITGKRGQIAENVKQAFRDSGLSHLLAIAGLHLGLVGAFVFFAVRGGLALVPFVALRWPIKKVAAGVTLAALFCYLMISGAAIPTERAFVMNGIVFAAILIDRLRLSMRICALAALVVLLLAPASLVGVSFQMSFGAVVALVAVYETWGTRLGLMLQTGSIGRRLAGYFAAVALTTLIVTIGTEPFAIYHFHHVVLYSPLANVIAVPVSAIWTLPCGVLACLLMPFGLEKLALVPMGWGIDLTIAVAQWVAALPGNVWPVARLPTAGVVLVALGGCWLCLWQGRWRLFGACGIVAGMLMMLTVRPPDLVLADFGRLLAARAPDGGYFVAASADPLDRSFLADDTATALAEWPPTGIAGTLDCREAGRCFYTAHGRRVALVTAAVGLPIVCGTVDAILAQVPAGFACRHRIPVADRIDNWRDGAVALWLDDDGVRMESANGDRGDRPWVPHPVSARQRARLTAAQH